MMQRSSCRACSEFAYLGRQDIARPQFNLASTKSHQVDRRVQKLVKSILSRRLCDGSGLGEGSAVTLTLELACSAANP